MYSNHSHAAGLAEPRSAAEMSEHVLRLSAYVRMLRDFGWGYAYNGLVVSARFDDVLEALRHEQKQIDPTGEIWRMVAPRGHGVPGPVCADGIRGTLGLPGFEAEDGSREYACQFWRDGEDREQPHEVTVWAHTGADAMREVYKRFGINIAVVVERCI